MGNSTQLVGSQTRILGIFGNKLYFTWTEKFSSQNVNAQRLYSFDGTSNSSINWNIPFRTQSGLRGNLVAYNNLVIGMIFLPFLPTRCVSLGKREVGEQITFQYVTILFLEAI